MDGVQLRNSDSKKYLIALFSELNLQITVYLTQTVEHYEFKDVYIKFNQSK